jgi:hypothetical protein
MKAILQGLREVWEDIEKCQPCAPPGYEKGGQLAFIVWFGGFGLILLLGLLS